MWRQFFCKIGLFFAQMGFVFTFVVMIIFGPMVTMPYEASKMCQLFVGLGTIALVAIPAVVFGKLLFPDPNKPIKIKK